MRRIASVALAMVLGAVALPGGGRSASAAPRLAVYVIVVDGLRPGQVDALTPNLRAFRDGATWYDESRAVMVAETLPNHVAMMTGTYPERNGIAANRFWDRTGEPEDVDLSDPRELTSDTLFTTLARRCPSLATAATLSKKYLYEVFEAGGRNVAPDSHWDPRPVMLPDPDEHALDRLVADAAIERIPGSDFLFVSLGDVDRSGHADVFVPLTLVPAFQSAARVQADAHFGRIIQAIHEAGRWEHSVVFVVSDHGMDWTRPEDVINLQPDLPPGLVAVDDGSGEHIYVVNRSAPDRHALLKRARDVALATRGVEHAWYRQPNPLDRRRGSVLPGWMHLGHENAGDLIVLARQGFRFSEPNLYNNPVPGNHGHLATRHNTFMVGGGAAFVRAGQRIRASIGGLGPRVALREQSENVDVAPTVAWLLGLPVKGYQGRVLREAFTVRSPPTRCGVPRRSAA